MVITILGAGRPIPPIQDRFGAASKICRPIWARNPRGPTSTPPDRLLGFALQNTTCGPVATGVVKSCPRVDRLTRTHNPAVGWRWFGRSSTHRKLPTCSHLRSSILADRRRTKAVITVLPTPRLGTPSSALDLLRVWLWRMILDGSRLQSELLLDCFGCPFDLTLACTGRGRFTVRSH